MDAVLTLIEKTAYLKSSPILAAMPIEALAQLAARARELHLDEGDYAFREGDDNRGTFLVVDGMMQVGQGSAIHTLRGPGEGFGELALAEGQTHQISAMAVQHTHLLNVPNEDLFETILDFPEVGLAIVRFMSQRIVDLGRRLHDLEEQLAKLNAVLRRHGIEVPRELEPEPGAAEGAAPRGH